MSLTLKGSPSFTSLHNLPLAPMNPGSPQLLPITSNFDDVLPTIDDFERPRDYLDTFIHIGKPNR